MKRHYVKSYSLKPQHIMLPRLLLNTLHALAEATHYQEQMNSFDFVRHDGSHVKFKINNREVLEYLKQPLNSANFKQLFEKAKNKGVFKLIFEAHIPSVTEVAGSKEMLRKWPRDHAGMMELIKDIYPNEEIAGLEKMAEAHLAEDEVKSFLQVIKKPQTFADNHGISHVFFLNSETGEVTRDAEWSMRQRIESHGEFLRALINCTLKYPDKVSKAILENIVYFTHYLYAIGPEAPTCGPWEEIAIAKGSNWDSASVIKAFELVQELMNSPHAKIKKQLRQLEQKLIQKTGTTPLLADGEALDKFCQCSAAVIRKNYLDEFRGITARVDAASLMLAAEEFDLSDDDNMMVNIRRHLQLLEKNIAALVGEYGGRRYNRFEYKTPECTINSCDGYLNLNYDILYRKFATLDEKEKYEAKDASKPEIFIERAAGCCDDTSAQWGLPLSYVALAYGRLVKKLLRHHQKAKSLATEQKSF